MKAVPAPSDKTLRHEGPLNFALWGLDRTVKPWRRCQTDKPIIHIGPGIKSVLWQTDVIDYPEYDLDGFVTVKQGNALSTENINESVDVSNNFSKVESTRSLPVFTHQVSGRDSLPFDADTVGGIYAVCVLEHLFDISWIISEAGRVLAPGAPFNILVPHPDSIMHKEDADHKSRQVLDSWENLLNNPYYTKGKLNDVPLEVGFNMLMAVKEDNLAVVTQLIKKDSE